MYSGDVDKYIGYYDSDTGEYVYPTDPQNLAIIFSPASPDTPFYLSAIDGDFSADGVTFTSEIGSSEDTTIGNASAKVLTATMLNPQATMGSLEWGYGAVFIGYQSYKFPADFSGSGNPVGVKIDGTTMGFCLKSNGDAYLTHSATTYTLGGDPIAVIANSDGTDVLFVTSTKIGRYFGGSFSVMTTPTASQDYLAKKYRDFPTTIGVMLNADGCPVKYNCEETNTCQEYRYIPMGTFDFSNVDARGLAFTAEAYDKMVLFDSDATAWINNLDFTAPKTVNDLINELATEFGFTATVDANAVNLTFQYTANPFVGYTVTYRQVLKWLAEMTGCNVRMGRTDVVEFFVFANSTVVVYRPDIIINGSRTTARYTTPHIDKIVCYDTTGTPYSSGAGSGAYYIVSNPLFQGLSQSVAILDSIKALFLSIGTAFWGYTPTTISVAYAYPGVDAGDNVHVMSADGSGDFVPVMRQTLRWNGRCSATITATGKQQRTIPDGEITSLTGSVGNSNPVAAVQGYFGGISVASADYPNETIDIFPDSITLEDATHTKTITADGPTPDTGSNSDTLSSSNNYQNVASLSIPAGTSLVTVHVNFTTTNSSGRRSFVLSNTSGSNSEFVRWAFASTSPSSSGWTPLQVSGVIQTASATTKYLNVFQNSGSSLGVNWYYSITRLA